MDSFQRVDLPTDLRFLRSSSYLRRRLESLQRSQQSTSITQAVAPQLLHHCSHTIALCPAVPLPSLHAPPVQSKPPSALLNLSLLQKCCGRSAALPHPQRFPRCLAHLLGLWPVVQQSKCIKSDLFLCMEPGLSHKILNLSQRVPESEKREHHRGSFVKYSYIRFSTYDVSTLKILSYSICVS
jgi:hypothetical protein